MKLAALLSAGLIAAAAMLPTTASAQISERNSRVVERNTTVRTVRDGYRPRYRRVCKVKYRNQRRIRTCRSIRR